MAADPLQTPSFLTALIAGGIAGTSVDVALFPIDTVKVRIQSPEGFLKAGGFRGIYNGLGAAAAGSAPGAALFFSTYERMKPICARFYGEDHAAWTHMTAAALGECAACIVRVPTEVVKARMQTSSIQLSVRETFNLVLQEHHGSPLSSVTGGLYRGFGMTLFREIPFAAIQFPLYETFKLQLAEYVNKQSASPVQAAACGSLSGAIAGGLTTPLDVLKTRMQLGRDKDGIPYKNVRDVLQRTLQQEGYSALWSGVQPRVMWISIGGFVFFGAYETSKRLVGPMLE